MAKHIVKCTVCKQSFDTNVIQAVKYSARRYAHQTCFPQGELVPMVGEEEGAMELREYINDLFSGTVNWGLVNKQIKNYHDSLGFSYSGMLKSLKYAYEIKKNNLGKAQGIGIVQICYQQAFDYYYALWEAQQKNADKEIFKPVEKIVVITPPQRKIKKRALFSFLDEEDN